MSTFEDILVELLPDIDREVGAELPEDPLGYGKDVFCTDDVKPNWDTLDGDDPIVVVNAAFRRLITDRGQLLDDPNYGFDVRQAWNQATSDATLEQLETSARSEVLKDDRVEDATVTLTRDPVDRTAVTFDLSLQLFDVDGTFALTFRVSERGVELT